MTRITERQAGRPPQKEWLQILGSLVAVMIDMARHATYPFFHIKRHILWNFKQRRTVNRMAETAAPCPWFTWITAMTTGTDVVDINMKQMGNPFKRQKNMAFQASHFISIMGRITENRVSGANAGDHQKGDNRLFHILNTLSSFSRAAI